MTLRIFQARAVRKLSDGNEQQVFEGELAAHHLCQAVSWLHEQLKREGLATAREILDGTVRLVSIREEREGDAQRRAMFHHGSREQMQRQMEGMAGQ